MVSFETLHYRERWWSCWALKPAPPPSSSGVHEGLYMAGLATPLRLAQAKIIWCNRTMHMDKGACSKRSYLFNQSEFCLSHCCPPPLLKEKQIQSIQSKCISWVQLEISNATKVLYIWLTHFGYASSAGVKWNNVKLHNKRCVFSQYSGLFFSNYRTH